MLQLAKYKKVRTKLDQNLVRVCTNRALTQLCRVKKWTPYKYYGFFVFSVSKNLIKYMKTYGQTDYLIIICYNYE